MMAHKWSNPKRVKELLGTGISWLNKNVVKPLRPVIDTALDMSGFSMAKPLVNVGSRYIENVVEPRYNVSSRASRYIGDGVDMILDSQRYGKDKKYSAIFGNRLN